MKPKGVLAGERLERRTVLAAGIGFDPSTRIVTITGSSAADTAEVRQQGADLVVSLDAGGSQFGRTIPAASVGRILFSGLAGNDTFTNLSTVPCRAVGGGGADVLRGGDASDELLGGAGRDQVFGEGGFDRLWGGTGDDDLAGGRGPDSIWGEDGDDAMHGAGGGDALSGGKGNDEIRGGAGGDALDAGEGDDRLDGELGVDRLIGGMGLDHESDAQDGFADGDADGDGYDDDYDAFDILFESPGNPRAYADDAAAAPIITAVTTQLRNILQLPAGDDGLQVRVQINDGTVTQPGRFGDLVTGVWRYLTPDKIQVWARWCYPASDPSQLHTFAQYSYNGPYSGDIADYGNPAYYTVSEESRLYAGHLRGATTFVSWLPEERVGFFYSAPNEQATGYPAPIERLTALLGSQPDFAVAGDSFSGSVWAEPGFGGVQPIVDLLRGIEQVNRTWYAEQRAARRR